MLLWCVNCVTSNQIQSVNGSAVSGAIPVGSVPAGSISDIQNTTTPQEASNFNITGNGTVGGTLNANLINATTQYNIGGQRVFVAAGSNLFASLNAGTHNTGFQNAFFGAFTGEATTSDSNYFFGVGAGDSNPKGLL